jgi:hypothetical protein
MVADLNGDGHLDVVFASVSDGATVQVNSYVYWGSATGFSAANRAELPTLGASQLMAADPGAISNRAPAQVFVSRPLDTGTARPTYTELSCAAAVVSKTSLRLQLRSAASEADLESVQWYGPTSTGDYYVAAPAGSSEGDAVRAPIHRTHNGDRFVQYRAVLYSENFCATPVLDRVTIHYREGVGLD